MRTKRRKSTAAFKAEVAIEALKERESMVELTKRFEVHRNMISKWEKEFLECSAEIFSTRATEVEFDIEREKLYAKLEKLEVERDWLKEISRKVGL